ncbi:ABC transporter ATP-binding protein [Selenomonas ruminantium]|uniref:ABC transporter ATP-binding protein n=1 Tax=Selenomonas ruminantium TaxID=971 RepID=UPI00055ABE8C|nr:ABC transporter ATP-binding protein [Selenomonas ruminantium]
MSKENNSISIQHVGKCYKMYASRNDRLKEWLIPFSRKRHEEKWVLKDVNIEVAPGEAVGIIGMNGAGKSTLLKIITGTTVPTTGSVHFNGRVSALLELGLGFHPDFTGRQNVYMSGQLLGYTIDEINECMEQVEAFAEIGNAIDAPVRTYSSGMQVRLAFAVATMKRPDILIVDEALSVGDTYFQHKSFGRIKDFCAQGTTLLLVSHDIAAINAVCKTAVLLDHGSVLKKGSPSDVIEYYNAMLAGDASAENIEQEKIDNEHIKTSFGNHKARIESVKILNDRRNEASVFRVGEHINIRVEAIAETDLANMNCGIMIKNRLGESVFGINSSLMKQELKDLQAGEKIIFEFSCDLNLGEETYSLSVALHSGEDHLEACYEWQDLAYVFKVVNQDKYKFAGVVYMKTVLSIERNDNDVFIKKY